MVSFFSVTNDTRLEDLSIKNSLKSRASKPTKITSNAGKTKSVFTKTTLLTNTKLNFSKVSIIRRKFKIMDTKVESRNQSNNLGCLYLYQL